MFFPCFNHLPKRGVEVSMILSYSYNNPCPYRTVGVFWKKQFTYIPGDRRNDWR